jgi:RNA polymerase sigma-70 factor, ECF subfamily
MDDTAFQRLLEAWVGGDKAAGDQLYATAYDELRGVARRSLRAYGRGGQVSTTVLVNECYLKLAGRCTVDLESRAHFLALCARAMRQIIVDAARRSLTARRSLEDPDADFIAELVQHAPLRPDAVVALDQALAELEAREPRLARIAECRIFADLPVGEIARTLGITERTVQREWLRIKGLLSVVAEAG